MGVVGDQPGPQRRHAVGTAGQAAHADITPELGCEPALHGGVSNRFNTIGQHRGTALQPDVFGRIVVKHGRIGHADAGHQRGVARRQRLRGHAAHAQPDKMHRLATGNFFPDQPGCVVGQHVQGVRARRHA